MTENKQKLVPPADRPGVGLDIGTMNIVSARRGTTGVVTRRIRDAFLDLEPSSKKMLKLNDTTYIDYDDHILLLGDDALHMSTMLKRELRRPLSAGLISSSEHDALDVLSILIERVLGEPVEEGEFCYYSIPAAPLDMPGKDVIFHEAVFGRILEELGYTAISGNEAMAIVYAECAKDAFSGIGISYGSGMVNCALSFQSMPILEFSLARGGDWLDQKAAGVVGTTAERMCGIKEAGVDLMDPQGREQEALVVYYRSLIDYSLKSIAQQFIQTQSDTSLTAPIPIVVSGGTSRPEGFIELFQQVFDKKHKRRFPLEVSEVRRASDPMTAVAEGLLVQALQEYA